ncbi:MAG TPA: glycosyltransferase family 4 protein [Acidobacteriota bacterium]|nr:glycosyltransferase family 4 protein [Acidobacteriota bacterium]
MTLKKPILFLNRSFYPDVESTGQLLTELCEELAYDFEVHVVCGNPLYRKVKNRGLVTRSKYKDITIWRVNNTRLPKKHLFNRLMNLLSYFILCFFKVMGFKKVSCVISETDPPLLGLIACLYSKLRKVPFVYYVQDLYPNVGIVSRQLTNPLVTKILKRANKFLYDSALQIIVPGRDMKKRLEEENHIPSAKIKVVENWADPRKIYPVPFQENEFYKKNFAPRFVVMYSGNLGLSQDLENVICAADLLKEKGDIFFVLIGEGAAKNRLMDLSRSLGLKNVKFLAYQDKKDLKFTLGAAHIHLVPMKKGMGGIIVPSKIYGIMAAGKSYIAALDKNSEVHKITDEFECGINIPPSDAQELKNAVVWAYNHKPEIEEMGKKGRRALEQHYSREICTQKFKQVIHKTCMH